MKKPSLIYKRLLIAGCSLLSVGVLTLLTWPLPLALFGELFGWLNGLISHETFWSSVGVVIGILLATVLFGIYVWPIITFTAKRIYVYLSLALLCISRRYKFRLNRIPFASWRRMNDDGDITISAKTGTLHLHFLDIIYPRKRLLTFPNENEYAITRIKQGNIVREGGSHPVPVAATQQNSGHRRFIFRATGYSMQKNKECVRKLPTIEKQSIEKHFIIVQTRPVDVFKVVTNSGRSPVSNGSPIGAFCFCTVSHLKKGLKHQLHNSLLDYERKEV